MDGYVIKQIHWRDLEHGKIYKIKSQVLFEDEERLRLILKDSKGLYSLWVPDRIRYAIEGQDITHVRSNGKVHGKWEYDIICYDESPMHN